MPYRIQLRRDDAAAWTSENPTLFEGEIGLETDTGKLKIGDGTTKWNALAYFGGAPSGTATGDLAGTYPNPTVDGLQGRPVASTAPTNGQVLGWDGSSWAPTASAGVATGDKGDISVTNSGNTWTIDNDVVTYAKMQNVSAASKLLGRGDAGSGDVQEITLGTGLTMSGTTLNAAGGGSGDGVSLSIVAFNNTGTQIDKGKIVYINGSHGSSEISIALADADSETTSSHTIGCAAENIAHGSSGQVRVFGYLTGLTTNTSDYPATEGDPFYLSSTAGSATPTLPVQPKHGVRIGFLVKRAGSGAGSVFVAPQNYQELEELSDVLIAGAAEKHVLSWDASAGVWKNRSLSDAGIAAASHAHSGADITSGTVGFDRLPTGTSNSTVAVGNHGHTLAGDVTGALNSTVIANDAVTANKIANGAVTSTKYADGSISETKLAGNSVSSIKIQTHAVTGSKLADNAVVFEKMQDIPYASLIGRRDNGTDGDPESIYLGPPFAFSNNQLIIPSNGLEYSQLPTAAPFCLLGRAVAGQGNIGLIGLGTGLRFYNGMLQGDAVLLSRVVEYTSSGTFTKSPGSKFILYQMCGGGAGGQPGFAGASGSDESKYSHGGNAGVYAEGILFYTGLSDIAVTIGTGGFGGQGQPNNSNIVWPSQGGNTVLTDVGSNKTLATAPGAPAHRQSGYVYPIQENGVLPNHYAVFGAGGYHLGIDPPTLVYGEGKAGARGPGGGGAAMCAGGVPVRLETAFSPVYTFLAVPFHGTGPAGGSGTSGANGTSADSSYRKNGFGAGGGGGGTNTSGKGGKGGNGDRGGGGGAGGRGSSSGGGGDGGDGGPGFVRLIEVYSA